MAFADLRLAGPIIFRRPKIFANPQIHNFSPYEYKNDLQNLRRTFGFCGSFELHGISLSKYTYVGKKISQTRIRNTVFFLVNFGFAICGRGHQGNLRMCNLRIIHNKLADLRFADWHPTDIC